MNFDAMLKIKFLRINMKKTISPTEQAFINSGLSKEEINNRMNSMGLSISEEEINKRINNAVLKCRIDVNYNMEWGYSLKEERKFHNTLKETLAVFNEIKISTINRVLLQDQLIKKVNEYETNKEENECKQAKIEIFLQLPFIDNTLGKADYLKKDPYILNLSSSKGKTNNKQKQEEIEKFLGFYFCWN